MFIKEWDRFWRLVATWWYRIQKRNNWKTEWFYEFICDCWEIVWKRASDVKRWKTNSCWCLRKDNTSEMFTKHWCCKWYTQNKLYRAYQWIKDRCTNKKNEYYEVYWWRGIKCVRGSFEQFKEDMENSLEEHLKKYWEKNTTIDRIDVDWDYCKENCRWATYKQQANNTRRNRNELREWQKMSIRSIYDVANPVVNYTTFQSRYYKLKWPLKDCLYRLPWTKTYDVLNNKYINYVRMDV